MGKGPDAPDVPTAGENYAEALEAMLQNQGSTRQLEYLDSLGKLAIASRLAPVLANIQLGFEEQFGPQMRAAESEATRQSRLGDIDNIQQLAPLFQSAAYAADPTTERLRQTLGASLQEQLEAGAGLDPSLRREIQQGIRAAQTARGMTRGNAPISEEAFALGTRGTQLRAGRQQAAESFLRTQAATAPDALSFITGRPSQTAAMPMIPQSGVQGQLQNMAGMAQQQNNIASQTAYNAAQLGAGGGIGGAASGALSGAAMGSAVPGIGTGVGAILGGIAGLL